MIKAILVGALASAAVSSPSVAADVTKQPPFIEQHTAKSLGDISGCVSKAWQSRSGQTAYIPGSGSFTMRLSYPIVSTMLVAVQVDAVDLGNERLVKVFARKGDRSKKLTSEINGCL